MYTNFYLDLLAGGLLSFELLLAKWQLRMPIHIIIPAKKGKKCVLGGHRLERVHVIHIRSPHHNLEFVLFLI